MLVRVGSFGGRVVVGIGIEGMWQLVSVIGQYLGMISGRPPNSSSSGAPNRTWSFGKGPGLRT